MPSFVVGHLHDQVRTANAHLGPLRATTTTATAGIEFAGSHLIGADADLLVDGLLLDFKAKNETTTIKKPDVYQLAGYTLLDFDDTHHIERVGIYWTRHGVMQTFTVPDFFGLLGATAPLADLRAELHAELAAHDALRRERLARQAERGQSATIEQTRPPEDTRLTRSVRWLRDALRR